MRLGDDRWTTPLHVRHVLIPDEGQYEALQSRQRSCVHYRWGLDRKTPPGMARSQKEAESEERPRVCESHRAPPGL